MKNELSRMTIDIPAAMHKKFKQLAARHGISMRQMVVDYIKEQIEHEGKECPYDHTPNAQTRKAMKETDKGKGLVRAKDAKDLFKKLGI
jgi:antitoxin component of RelBE/YafQ-DinJ toxin-antitoxin module